jgi:polyhydroxyalkanoate synthesis regulator phasin
MPKRQEVFTDEKLSSLLGFHPYLFIFQKEDWKQYLLILAMIYDYLDEQTGRVPFETIKFLVQKFYLEQRQEASDEKVYRTINKIFVEELGLLKDSHDQYGQRYLDSTRSGKDFLSMMESLLIPKTKFSGTGAETLLGALNSILIERQHMQLDEALAHHRQWIKKYQDDISRIQKLGVDAAELLPLPHTNEALFAQAEQAARHILSSVEDVKDAIEKQRKQLAESYMGSTNSPGKNLTLVADFYQRLFATQEYRSYDQAKNLFSYLETYTQRYKERNIDRLLYEIVDRSLISKEEARKSYLQGFARQFAEADKVIHEKTAEQIRILKMQVNYALSNDLQGGRKVLQELFSKIIENRMSFSNFFQENKMDFEIPESFQLGDIDLSPFRKPIDIQMNPIDLNSFNSEEQRSMMDALLQAEEASIEMITDRFVHWLKNNPEGTTLDYEFKYGLSEYYILNEISLFLENCTSSQVGIQSLIIPTKFGQVILKNVGIYNYKIQNQFLS